MKKYRVKRHRWTKNGDIETFIIFISKNAYKAITAFDRIQPDKSISNNWFEDYPYKWYEFHNLREFLNNLFHTFRQRYTKQATARLYIKDVSIVILGGLILTYISNYNKKNDKIELLQEQNKQYKTRFVRQQLTIDSLQTILTRKDTTTTK